MAPIRVVVFALPPRVLLLFHFEGVSRLMILDLEAEKTVDSSKRLGIVSDYAQLRSAHGILGLIGDLAFQLVHGLYTWRHSGMDKHWNSKIALRKLYCDHRQMLTDSLLASCIGGLVALYLDSTAVSQEMEIMSRQLVTKTHAFVTAYVQVFIVISSSRRWLLAKGANG